MEGSFTRAAADASSDEVDVSVFGVDVASCCRRRTNRYGAPGWANGDQVPRPTGYSDTRLSSGALKWSIGTYFEQHDDSV